MEPSQIGYAYDYPHTPDDKRIGKRHSGPNAGIYKIGYSDFLYRDDQSRWDEDHNWFDYLASQRLTVATWSQPGGTLDDAYPSAAEAFSQLLEDTRARSPTNPPPIALIGHSRGGLLIRRLLKEEGSKDRVRWVVTLHSPHAGSELARAPAEFGAEVVDLMDHYAPAQLTGPLKRELKELVVELLRPLNRWILEPGARELVPDGPLVRSLADGERPLENIKYYTFGGVRPTFFRLYVWLFDAMSTVPQYSGFPPRQYFVWTVKAAELGSVSPLLEKVRDFIPEVTPGRGDGFVADERARLPFAIHETTELNHAEVLWDRALQQRVTQLLLGSPRRPQGR